MIELEQPACCCAHRAKDAVVVVVDSNNEASLLFQPWGDETEVPAGANTGRGLQLSELPEHDDMTKGTSKVAAAIEYVDLRWRKTRPAIVVAYHCVKRAVSVRSDDRVLTHIIASLGSGSNTADVHQALMRGAGYTRVVGWLHAAYTYA